MISKFGYGLLWLQNLIYTGASVDVNALLNQPDAADKAGGPLEGVAKLFRSLGAGTVNITRETIVYIAVYSMLAAGIGLMVFGKNPVKRGEEKEGIAWKAVGMVISFAAVSLVIFFQTVGENLL